MSEPRASARAQQPPAQHTYQPGPNTVWLMEDIRDARWEHQCRAWILETFGNIQGEVVSKIFVPNLQATHEIVVLFADVERLGHKRENAAKTWIGVKVRRSVAKSEAVKCADYFPPTSDDQPAYTVSVAANSSGAGLVQIANARDADGRTKRGLAEAIMRACMVENGIRLRNGAMQRVPTVRALFRPDIRELRVARDS